MKLTIKYNIIIYNLPTQTFSKPEKSAFVGLVVLDLEDLNLHQSVFGVLVVKNLCYR